MSDVRRLVAGRSPVRPLSRTERMWSSFDIAATFGPLALPPVEDLRFAAEFLAKRAPALRLDVTLDLDAGRWTATTGRRDASSGLVVDDLTPDSVGLSAYLRHVSRRRSPTAPLTFVVSGPYLTLLMNHALGDASLAITAIMALLDVAETRRLPAWLAVPTHQWPLAEALRRRYLRDPRALWKAMTLDGGRTRERRAVGSDVLSDTPVVHDSDAVYRNLSAEASADLLAWVRRYASSAGGGATLATVTAVLAERALTAKGLRPTGGPIILVDARRYLPRTALVLGNFVTGVGLASSGRWELDDLHRQSAAALAVGRPLVVMAGTKVHRLLTSAGAAVAARRTSSAQRTVPGLLRGSGPVVVISSIGGHALDRLPWAAPEDDIVAASMVTTVPAQGLTVSTVSVQGRLRISLSFHRSVYDPALMADVLDLIATHPVALLEETL